jgi:hypothetical protein
MSVRTTVTLDEDVYARLREVSRERGVPLTQSVNDALRSALSAPALQPRKVKFKIRTFPMGLKPGINYDCTADMLEAAEGPLHR